MRESDYEETHNEKVFWDTNESVENNSYYFATLSGYSPLIHKPYAAYLERLEQKKNGIDMFSGVGINNDDDINIASKCIHNKNIEELDLSWLDSL